MIICSCLLQEAPECESAKEMFGGRLIPDVLTERLGLKNCADITCLTLQSFSIRQWPSNKGKNTTKRIKKGD